jgi:E3 ubiquitin-protein ligase DOA10
MKETNNSSDDFIVSPCDCRGSCRSVHFSCLQTWSQRKAIIVDKNTKATNYHVGKLFCEICKSKYPRFFIKDDKVYELCQLR